MGTEPLVIAHALLRSAAGERPGSDVPISADTVARLAPAPEAVEAVAAHFRRAGFELLGSPGATIGLAGPRVLFEHHFGVALELLADHCWVVRGARRSKAAAFDRTLIPGDRLPQPVRALVSQIALDAAATLDDALPGADA